jgi:hypothetical protein
MANQRKYHGVNDLQHEEVSEERFVQQLVPKLNEMNEMPDAASRGLAGTGRYPPRTISEKSMSLGPFSMEIKPFAC